MHVAGPAWPHHPDDMEPGDESSSGCRLVLSEDLVRRRWQRGTESDRDGATRERIRLRVSPLAKTGAAGVVCQSLAFW